ncbi:MAG: RNA-directed DNA polymerase (Reverse transcriptase) [Microgenomates group bacterium Gr01-1014_93]|nr:MAG: RNA-directed DNA polymerase (Reverse transcriptase) [Microgenomates group bacterium Gr01-1014_93]
MRNNIHPDQICLFDPTKDRRIIERERERDRRLGHIYQDIISIENLLISYQEFLRGKRKRKDVAKFSLYLMDNIITLHQDLKEKKYKHGPYHAFKINDPKPRDIHKATVRDRILHHAIYRILYPYFDKKFIFDSYSCRNDKGTHRAMNRFQSMARKVSRNNTRTAWVLKGDIRKFFATIDHRVLKAILRRHIEDKNIFWLLDEIINSFHIENGTNVGLPLGNVTSQLLVNIYMNEFDQFLKRKLKVKYCVRYADDFVILSENKEYLENLITQIAAFLKTNLGLLLNEKKVCIQQFSSGVDFLGWVHFPHHRVLRTTTKRRMFMRLKQNHTEETVASYLGLLKHGNTYKLVKSITKGKL